MNQPQQSMKQQTLKSVVQLEGTGLHSGAKIQLEIHPAPEGHGIQFKRTDLEGDPLIKAASNKVFNTERHTVLGTEKANIATVEHLMSAFYALSIDNALVEINGPELPIMDGSALPFIEAIQNTGIEEQEKEKDVLEILQPITIKDGDSEITILPADELEITVMVDFNSEVLSPQFASLNNIKDFSQEIAASRTFVFLHELEALVNHGLAKGGSPDNAVVFVEKVPTESQASFLNQQYGLNIEVKQTGLLEGTELRYANEAARHKLLDLIGDLALSGTIIKGKIFARKPGHKINTMMAEELRKTMVQQRKIKDIPIYDPNKAPVYNITDIFGKLQHRYPFLLIDKIIELSDTHVVSVKNVTFNEPFFPGHFPDNPIMPGVLQIEALAQTGGILVMESIEDPLSYDTYFLKIDNARFRKPVIPGDTVLFRMDLSGPIRRGLVEMKGRAFVGNTLVAEADLLAQIIKRK
jgi:UDP-3-O-[3-hydroxymyristoyl] N-acetylglucosamine deacetylase/3-hydroxyacyl-[acyl-carrier-protein] dehydratase